MDIEVRISSKGLEDKHVYLTHEAGGWCDDNGDYLEHKFVPTLHDAGILYCIADDFISSYEGFKIVVIGFDSMDDAITMLGQRIDLGRLQVNFTCWDPLNRRAFLLAPGWPIIREGKWNPHNTLLPAKEQ